MEIRYQDSQILVCIKPVGMDSEHQVPEALGIPVYPVHRLDKNVAGIMVYAKTKAAAARLSQAVQEGLLLKEYVALVRGTPPEQGVLEDLLLKDSRQNKVFVVKRLRKGVKPARLAYISLTAGDPSLLHIRLDTGRSHQIRVQFASRGCPLVGDHKYGARDDLTAPQLYACRLTFPHQGRTLSFQALPPWAELDCLPPFPESLLPRD